MKNVAALFIQIGLERFLFYFIVNVSVNVNGYVNFFYQEFRILCY
jgi:hypothetical protein